MKLYFQRRRAVYSYSQNNIEEPIATETEITRSYRRVTALHPAQRILNHLSVPTRPHRTMHDIIPKAGVLFPLPLFPPSALPPFPPRSFVNQPPCQANSPPVPSSSAIEGPRRCCISSHPHLTTAQASPMSWRWNRTRTSTTASKYGGLSRLPTRRRSWAIRFIPSRIRAMGKPYVCGELQVRIVGGRAQRQGL